MIKPLYVIGLSQASAYILYPLIGLYFFLAIYAVLGGWRLTGDRQRVRPLRFLALSTTAFLALWFAGGAVWTLLLWLQFGDAGFYYGRWTAKVIAAIVSAILVVRLATGRATRSYVRFNSWGAGLCIALYAAMLFFDFADRIDGWTARGAAENKFAHMMEGSEFYPAHLPRRIADETTPRVAKRGGKEFALYIGEERAAEILVMPYYRWWWSVGRFRNFPFGDDLSVQEQLQRFHDFHKNKKAATPLQ